MSDLRLRESGLLLSVAVPCPLECSNFKKDAELTLSVTSLRIVRELSFCKSCVSKRFLVLNIEIDQSSEHMLSSSAMKCENFYANGYDIAKTTPSGTFSGLSTDVLYLCPLSNALTSYTALMLALMQWNSRNYD